jgi:hypothetical protein
MLTELETKRRSRRVPEIVVGYDGSSESDGLIAAECAGLQLSVVAVRAPVSGPDWLGGL